jgi:hypothetical protein
MIDKTKYPFRTSEYSDIGIVHQFNYIDSDEWKKNKTFCNFAEMITRQIALEVGAPTYRIGFGKWGACFLIEHDDDIKQLKEWIDAIEAHPTFFHLREACKISQKAMPEGVDNDVAQYLDMMLEGKKRELLKDAVKDLNQEAYYKLRYNYKRMAGGKRII